MVEGKSDANQLRVFISYSRDDLAFADQLDAALNLHQYEVSLDRHGIAGGEDWQSRLGAMIRDADTIVFILSPSSAHSNMCRWEVEEAVRLHKRIIPVTCRALEAASPPPPLSALNYIFFYAEPRAPGSGFGTGLARLVAALNTDLDWLREHTRLLQRANEWEAAGRAESRLLFADSIAGAKAWAARRPKDAPEPTALHYEFIRASEEAEARHQNAERQQLQQIAAAQTARSKALAEKEEAQEREAEQARRVVRRTLVGLAAAVLLAIVAAGAGVLAFRNQREAEAERDRTRAALADVLAERAWSAVHSGSMDRAMRYAVAGWRIAPQHAAHYRVPLARALVHNMLPARDRTHHGRIKALAPGPNGKWIISAGDDGLAVLFDVASLHPMHIFSHGEHPVAGAHIDPSGTKVFTFTTDGVIRIWNAQTGDPLSELYSPDQFIGAIMPSDASRLVTVSRDQTTRLWDLSAQRVLATLVGHQGDISAIAFSPDGLRMATGSEDHTARLWDARSGQELMVFARHTGTVTALAFSADGRLLLTGSADKSVLVYDTASGTVEPKTLQGHDAGIRAIASSSDSAKAYVIDVHGNAYIWDMRTARILVASPSESTDDGVTTVDEHGRYVAIAEQGGKLTVWDAEAARTFLELSTGTTSVVSALLWSGDHLFVGDASGTISAFDLREATRPITELVAQACSKEGALSPRFTWLESASDPLIRELWDPEGTVRSVCDGAGLRGRPQ
jgi:WD40 repeat protein